jgi:hypothetical protein
VNLYASVRSLSAVQRIFIRDLAGLERETSPHPITDGSSPEHLKLADGRRAERVPCPRRSCNRTVVFYHNGRPGVLVNDILHGKLVQDSRETVMVESITLFLQVN